MGWVPTGADAGGLRPMLGNTAGATGPAGVLPGPARAPVPAQPVGGSPRSNSLSCKALRVSSMSLRAPSLALSW